MSHSNEPPATSEPQAALFPIQLLERKIPWVSCGVARQKLGSTCEAAITGGDR